VRNVAPDVLLQCINKSFDNFETLNKAPRDIFTRSVKGAIRSTWCCGWHLNY
jgi:hypothetical protein